MYIYDTLQNDPFEQRMQHPLVAGTWTETKFVQNINTAQATKDLLKITPTGNKVYLIPLNPLSYSLTPWDLVSPPLDSLEP